MDKLTKKQLEEVAAGGYLYDDAAPFFDNLIETLGGSNNMTAAQKAVYDKYYPQLRALAAEILEDNKIDPDESKRFLSLYKEYMTEYNSCASN